MQKCLKLCQPVKSQDIARTQKLSNQKAKEASISYKSPNEIKNEKRESQSKVTPGNTPTNHTNANNYQSSQQATQHKKQNDIQPQKGESKRGSILIDDSLKSLLGDDIGSENSNANNTNNSDVSSSVSTIQLPVNAKPPQNNGGYQASLFFPKSSSSNISNEKSQQVNARPLVNNAKAVPNDNGLYFNSEELVHPNSGLPEVIPDSPAVNMLNKLNSQNITKNIVKTNLTSIEAKRQEAKKQLEDLQRQKAEWLRDLHM